MHILLNPLPVSLSVSWFPPSACTIKYPPHIFLNITIIMHSGPLSLFPFHCLTLLNPSISILVRATHPPAFCCWHDVHFYWPAHFASFFVALLYYSARCFYQSRTVSTISTIMNAPCRCECSFHQVSMPAIGRQFCRSLPSSGHDHHHDVEAR